MPVGVHGSQCFRIWILWYMEVNVLESG